jgi:hypothetical protein
MAGAWTGCPAADSSVFSAAVNGDSSVIGPNNHVVTSTYDARGGVGFGGHRPLRR